GGIAFYPATHDIVGSYKLPEERSQMRMEAIDLALQIALRSIVYCGVILPMRAHAAAHEHCFQHRERIIDIPQSSLDHHSQVNGWANDSKVRPSHPADDSAGARFSWSKENSRPPTAPIRPNRDPLQ